MTVLHQEEKKPGKTTANVPFEAKTMVLKQTEEKIIGPRLVCTSAAGDSEIFPLKEPKLVIGRSGEADLNLLDPLISRKHCVIEKRDDGFVVRNVSTTNPLMLNDKAIAEKRLFTGDQLKIGSVTLAFISDRPEDARKLDTKAISQIKRSGRGLWLAAFLIIFFAVYLGYFQAFAPLRIKWALNSVSKQIQSGKHLPAQNTLKHLLNLNLPPEQATRAMELLAQSALTVTQLKAKNESLESAMEYLKGYLAEYGFGKEAEILWDRLDYYRLTLADRLESAEDFQPALRQYAAIKEDSIYFEEAHKAIRRIWLAHQQQPRQDQSLVQLLKEADTHFAAQQYLKPVNQNAYVLYQAVLTLEPGHELALKRINEMKNFYLENGEKFFTKKKWSKALSFFERYYLIDSENEEINKKMKLCREKSADARALVRKKNQPVTSKSKKRLGKHVMEQEYETAERRAEIKRLLEESGTESSWIMEYLFEDQTDGNNSEKPW